MPIAEQLEKIRDEISSAARESGRNLNDIRLVAVSKTRPAADIRAAYRAGQIVFGENYVQELRSKALEISEPVEWHFIGHLQSNKVKQIAGLVHMIHSVDRLSLAEEINRQWGKLSQTCDILLQVNISGETTKSGAASGQALQLAREVAKLPYIRVKGLMTMPPFFDDPESARPFFAELRQLSEVIDSEKISGIEMRELSMGMSGDFQAAIQEGSTLVRIGTAIFGERT